MKNFTAFEEIAKKRISDEEELEKTMDIIKGFIFARVDNARIYAYAKTGIYSSKKATPEWHEAINEFNHKIRGH